MDNKVNGWLDDILRSIDEIAVFLPRQSKFLEFQKDLKTKKAIERNIEIIGEAVNRLISYKKEKILIKNAKQIIGTRNRIIHEYDKISDEIIWTIVIRELPKLKEEILQINKSKGT